VILQVKKGHRIFVHAAAGGVGSLLVQWGSSLGATVIAAVSNEEKAVQPKEDGADHVIIYSQENFVDRVKEITEGAGVEVVYDAVGKDTLKVSFPTTTCFPFSL
jgi:NADPH2:quinone reductase